MTEAKRLIKEFDFTSPDSAVSLVCEDQGGAANGYKTLLTKATDVVVELSFAEFLYRFTDMWYDESRMVAHMLGMSDDMSAAWDTEELSKRVTLMKAAKETKEYSEDLIETVKVLSKAVGVKIKDIDGVSPVNKSKTVEETPNEDNKMSDVDVQALIQKAVQDKEAELKKAAQEEFEAIKKGLEAELATFKAKEVEIQKAQFEEEALLYKSLGVTEDTKGEFAVALMKAKGDDSMKPIMVALEKAQNIIKQVEDGTFQPEGHSVESTAEEMSGVMKALNAMKESNK